MKRSGRVYVMEAANGYVKIGFSSAPERRLMHIAEAETIVYQTEPLEAAEAVEKRAHAILTYDGRHIRGEWFSATRGEAVAAVRAAVSYTEYAMEVKYGAIATPGDFRTALLALRLDAESFAALCGHEADEGRLWLLSPPAIAMTMAKLLLERPELLCVLHVISKRHERRPQLKAALNGITLPAVRTRGEAHGQDAN